MTSERIQELSTQLASSIAGKEPQDVENLCRSFIEMAVKEADTAANKGLKVAQTWFRNELVRLKIMGELGGPHEASVKLILDQISRL